MSTTLSNTTGDTRTAPRHAWRPCLATGLMAIGCLAGLIYFIANWEWPAGAAAGQAFAGSSPIRKVTSGRIRVATFNIHGGYGVDERLDLSRTAKALGPELDFVGLNEVRGGGGHKGRSQVEQLGQLLGCNWLFAPTETSWSGPHFGQGALSRLHVTSWRRVPFARVDGNGYRNYLECQVTLGTDVSAPLLTVLVTHLDRKSDRQDQLEVLIERFLEVPPPAILMGDLNSKRTEPQLIRLAKRSDVIDCLNSCKAVDLARRRIDWIFVRGLHCLTSNLELTDASDHPWGWAELALPESTPVP